MRASAAPLAPLLEASGGGVVRLVDEALPGVRKIKPNRDRHGRGWLGVTANNSYMVTGVLQAPFLPTPVLLVLILGAALLAWYREGR